MPHIERIVKQQHYQPESLIKDNQSISNPCKSTKPFSWVTACFPGTVVLVGGLCHSVEYPQYPEHAAVGSNPHQCMSRCDLCIHLCCGQGTVSPCRTTSTVGVTSDEACLDILHVEGSNSNEDSSRVVRSWNSATLRHPKNGIQDFFSRFEKAVAGTALPQEVHWQLQQRRNGGAF